MRGLKIRYIIPSVMRIIPYTYEVPTCYNTTPELTGLVIRDHSGYIRQLGIEMSYLNFLQSFYQNMYFLGHYRRVVQE